MAESFKAKVTIVGDGAIGKTCLFSSITNQAVNFDDGDPTYEPTTFNNFKLQWETEDGDEVNLEMWDTAGQESFSQLRKLSYPETDIYILGYSTTSQISLSNIENKWLEELRENMEEGRDDPWLVLCGTKVDIRDLNDGGVSKKQASDLATKIGCAEFLETSAKTRKGVEELKAIIMSIAVAKGKGEPLEVWNGEDDGDKQPEADVASPAEAPAADTAASDTAPAADAPKAENSDQKTAEVKPAAPAAKKEKKPPKSEKHVEDNRFKGDEPDGSKPKSTIASPRSGGEGKGEKRGDGGGDGGCTCSVM